MGLFEIQELSKKKFREAAKLMGEMIEALKYIESNVLAGNKAISLKPIQRIIKRFDQWSAD